MDETESGAVALPHRSRQLSIWLGVSVIALALLLMPVLFQSVLFLMKVPLSKASFAVGLAAGAGLPLVLFGFKRSTAISYLIVIAVVAASLLIQPGSWDNYHDSLSYHEPATIALAQGVNPVYESLENGWADHYPKAAWAFAAGTYQWSGNLETGKLVAILAALSCFGFAAAFFLSFDTLSGISAYTAASLATLNPVTLVQLDTHYVDGVLSSMSVLLVLLVLAADSPDSRLQERTWTLVALFCGAAVITANLKFTGLVFVGVVVLVHSLRILMVRRGLPGLRWQQILGVGCSVLMAIALVGASPYVTNTLQHGNPFYPVFGADLSTIDDSPEEQRPAPYVGRPAPLAFAMSLAEETSLSMEDPFRPKNPLTVSVDEMDALEFPDARRGGFGPLFLLAVLLALVTLVMLLIPRRQDAQAEPAFSPGYSAVLVTVLTLTMVEAWWARFAPVFFLLPLLVAVAGLSLTPRRWEPTRVLSLAVVAVLLVNTALIGYAQAKEYLDRRAAKLELVELVEGQEQVVLRFPDSWTLQVQSGAIARRLADLGFTVTIVNYVAEDPGNWVKSAAVNGEVLLR